MKRLKWYFLTTCALFLLYPMFAQDKLDIKFGKIVPADFDLAMSKFDSSADAVIIADIGSTSFEGNSKSNLTMIFTRFLRVKILNKNGFDIAKYEIQLNNNLEGDQEKLSELKASTFNLENGSIVETKLDDKSVFTERLNKYLSLKKFTMPALKEGSIYDVTYTIKSDFLRYLREWSFQGHYPRLWSEYETTIPPVLHYVVHSQGDNHFDVNTSKEVFQRFTIRQSNGTDADDIYNLSGKSIQQRWVKKNVPSLREEPFTTTLDNYITKVSFQLHYRQWTENSERIDYLSNWFVACDKWMNDEDFGLILNHDNVWMTEDLKKITEDCKSDEEKIKKIYSFFRDNFSCTSHQSFWIQTPLKDVYKKRGGTVTEINLLLTAMLRQAHFVADPVILSTRGNGIAEEAYPLVGDYDYVICVIYLGNKMFKLDASHPYNGFGHLVSDCYNGGARVVNKDKPILIDLSPDSLQESDLTSVFIVNDDKGNLSGSYQTIFGNEGSYEVRDEVKNSSQKDYLKKIQTQYGTDISVENMIIDSLSKYDFPVTLHYDIDLKNLVGGDVIYFNPMLMDIYKNNPFKSVERHYPVEMPYKIEDTYVLNMDIPKGYQVEELPKSVRAAYNGNEGIFEYLIQKNTDNIQMRVHLKLNKAFFPTDEYTTLRDFFGYVVKKENEQIVFKKIP